MSIYTYENVRVESPVTITSIEKMEIRIFPNQHGLLWLTGRVTEETAFSQINAGIDNAHVSVWGNGKSLFSGVLKDAEIVKKHGTYFINLYCQSATCKMDTQLKSRSFQDVSMTYADVAEIVLKDTPGASAIFNAGIGQAIGKPLIQYKETDWEFLKRIASHLEAPLIPECITGTVQFWFGMKPAGEVKAFSEVDHRVRVDRKYYELGGTDSGYDKSDFLCYIVSDLQNYNIGDAAVFQGKNLLICEKQILFKKSVLLFTYTLASIAYSSVRKYYNTLFTGLSLTGTAVKTDQELIDIHLDIDEQPGSTYSYNWVPSSGNLMYLMPQIGTKVSLYFPNHDEQSGYATDSPRTNGASCGDMADFNNRNLTTEHAKRMYLFPGSMGLVGTSGSSTPLHVSMDDENSTILFQSHKELTMLAKDKIVVSAPQVAFQTPSELQTIQSNINSESMEADILPVGTKG